MASSTVVPAASVPFSSTFILVLWRACRGETTRNYHLACMAIYLFCKSIFLGKNICNTYSVIYTHNSPCFLPFKMLLIDLPEIQWPHNFLFELTTRSLCCSEIWSVVSSGWAFPARLHNTSSSRLVHVAPLWDPIDRITLPGASISPQGWIHR